MDTIPVYTFTTITTTSVLIINKMYCNNINNKYLLVYISINTPYILIYTGIYCILLSTTIVNN